jgi:hypothetical protein
MQHHRKIWETGVRSPDNQYSSGHEWSGAGWRSSEAVHPQLEDVLTNTG